MGGFCYQCMLPTVQDGVCTRCGEKESASGYYDGSSLKPGAILDKGRFVVGKKIGGGSLGTTHIALDQKLNKRVALKEYMPGQLAVRQEGSVVPRTGKKASFEKEKKRFEKEARSWLELRAHPNLVHIQHIFRENNTVFYSMEMLDGISLREYVQRNRRLPAGRAFQLLFPVMQALQFAHDSHLVHGNISPDSIILSENPSRPGTIVPKLICFRMLHSEKNSIILPSQSLNKSGFIPYEQDLNQKGEGSWTDVYAICAVLYYMITGREPVAPYVRSGMGRDPLPIPRKIGADVSLETQDVLLQGMQLRYSERIQSMDELMRRMIQSFGQESDIREWDQALSGSGVSRRPTLRRAGAWAAEIALLALGMWFLRDGGLYQRLGINKDPLLLSLLIVPDLIFLVDLVLIVTTGCTLGQLLFGLRLRDEDGERKPELLSAIPYSLLFASFGFPVGGVCGLIYLFSGKRFGPLERLTGVEVIRAKQPMEAGKEQGVISDPFFAIRQEETEKRGSGEDPIREIIPETETTQDFGSDQMTANIGQDIVTQPTQDCEEKSPASAHEQDRPAGPVALLLCTKAGKAIPNLQGMAVEVRPGMMIGKNKQKADVVVPDPAFSRQHCSFDYQPDEGWTIRDEHSTNGTYLNGSRLPPGGIGSLKNGFRITIGDTSFEFRCRE